MKSLPKSAYKYYMRSDAWRAKRREYLLSDLPQECYVCAMPSHQGIHLHHMTYARLGVELLTDLVPACESCHEKIHWLHRHCYGKLTVEQATKLSRGKGRRWNPRNGTDASLPNVRASGQKKRTIPQLEKYLGIRPNKKLRGKRAYREMLEGMISAEIARRPILHKTSSVVPGESSKKLVRKKERSAAFKTPSSPYSSR